MLACQNPRNRGRNCGWGIFKPHNKAFYRGLTKYAASLLRLFDLANLMLAKWRLMAGHAQDAYRKQGEVH